MNSTLDPASIDAEPAPALVRPCWLTRAALLIGAVLYVGLCFAADQPVHAFVREHVTPETRDLADRIGTGSEGQYLFAIGLLGWGLSRLFNVRAWRRRWLVVLTATVVAGIGVNIPRGFTGRTRPDRVEQQGWFGPHHDGVWLVGKSRYNSFPSGHTTVAAAFSFAMLFCFRRLGPLALVFTLIVAWSRVWLGAHYFSDTAVGFALGGLLAWFCWRWYLDRGWVPQQSPLSIPWPGPAVPSVARSA